jgi:hypothetical protein
VIVVKSIIKKLSIIVLVAALLVAAQVPLASAASNHWSGSGDGVNWSDGSNWSLLRAPVGNDVTVFNSAISTEEAMMAYNNQSNLRLNGITFTGDSANGYILAGNTIQLAGEIRDQNTDQSINYVANNILAKGTVKVAAVNNAWLFTAGKFTMGSYPLYFRSYHNALNYFGGVVVGTGSVYVVGDNSGTTMFGDDARVLRPTIVKDHGRLSTGGAEMSNLTITTSGYFDPVECSSTKNLRIEGYHYITIDGSPTCANYGRINATGTVNVTNGKLMVADALDGGYKPVQGARYVLVSNDGSDKVIGAYKNRPEGSKFKIGSLTFKITYKGGTGNDIVITRL